MFDFLSMFGNYEQRKVDRFEQGKLMVDTCAVTDGAHPYETAVAHPDYNGGDWVIVEAYDTEDAAQIGHNAWVKTMTSEHLPDVLTDCANSEIGQLSAAVGNQMTFPRVLTE